MHIGEKTRSLLFPKALALAKVFLLALIPVVLAAQEDAGTGLPNLIRSNQRFGTNLLLRVHSTQPERNVAVSPLSLTLTFAALQSGLGYFHGAQEIRNAFGWGEFVRLDVPARMLLAAFDKPEPFKRHSGKISLKNPYFLARPSEGAWIANAFLYRAVAGKEPISPRFVAMAHKYYGVEFRSTGSEHPTEASLKANEHVTTSVPRTSRTNDILISSGTHLQTAWKGNTFSESEPHIGAFETQSGTKKQVQVLDSEMESYLYAKTDRFEAVVLPCNHGYILVVLPAPGRTIQELERQLADAPDSVDAVLQKRLGSITMPIFHLKNETDLRPSLEAMGIKTMFTNLGEIVTIPKSHLTEVKQNVNFQVDKNGILADADTVMGAVYGGIAGGQEPFQVKLDRPFLFLVRDQTTNVLLFIGAVMDPTEN